MQIAFQLIKIITNDDYPFRLPNSDSFISASSVEIPNTSGIDRADCWNL